MKKFLSILCVTLITTQLCLAQEIVPAGQCFVEQIRKERAAVANALLLTDKQAKQRYDIVTKNAPVLDEKFRNLRDKSAELKELVSKDAPKSEISQKQKEINCIKKDIKKAIANENKEFEKILDHEQRSKLHMIQKLQRKSMKQKPKNYYKSNPKMREFGIKKNI